MKRVGCAGRVCLQGDRGVRAGNFAPHLHQELHDPEPQPQQPQARAQRDRGAAADAGDDDAGYAAADRARQV